MVKTINAKMKTVKNRKRNERKVRGKGGGEANVNA